MVGSGEFRQRNPWLAGITALIRTSIEHLVRRHMAFYPSLVSSPSSTLANSELSLVAGKSAVRMDSGVFTMMMSSLDTLDASGGVCWNVAVLGGWSNPPLRRRSCRGSQSRLADTQESLSDPGGWLEEREAAHHGSTSRLRGTKDCRARPPRVPSVNQLHPIRVDKSSGGRG